MTVRLVLEGVERHDEETLAWTVRSHGPLVHYHDTPPPTAGIRRWRVTTSQDVPPALLDVHRADDESTGRASTGDAELDTLIRRRPRSTSRMLLLIHEHRWNDGESGAADARSPRPILRHAGGFTCGRCRVAAS